MNDVPTAATGQHHELEDVLQAFVDELEDTGWSYSVLATWSARHPQYAEELANLVAGEALLRYAPASGEQVREERLLQTGLDAARGVLERARAERPTPAGSQALLPGLMLRARELGLNIRQVADRTGLSVSLVGELDRRLIRFASIPREIIQDIASALQTEAGLVSQYLQQGPSLATSASYRADQAPTVPEAHDFFDAVRQDPTLGEDRRAALLRLNPPGQP